MHSCMLCACFRAASEREPLSGLPEPLQPPKTKHSNHERDSSAVLIIGNELFNWGSSRDLLQAGTENFLTLKELSSPKPHLFRTQMDCQPAPGLPASVCEQWEGGVHPNAFVSLCTHASVTYWGPRSDIYFQTGDL